jgi:hypothetical protein
MRVLILMTHCRILSTKKLLLVFIHFEVTRAGMDDNYEYWEINLSFKALLNFSLDCGHKIYKIKKTGCRTDYTRNILSENC